MWKKRAPINRKKVHRFLVEQQGAKCAYCGITEEELRRLLRMPFKDIIGTYRNWNFEIDHREPDGGNGIDNLCLACPFCNRAKWNLPLPIFEAWLTRTRFEAFKCASCLKENGPLYALCNNCRGIKNGTRKITDDVTESVHPVQPL